MATNMTKKEALERIKLETSKLYLESRKATGQKKAKLTAAYRQWQSVGAQVRKGEKATTILAPRTGKVRDSEDSEKVIRAFTYFRPVSVFSSAQVDNWEMPEMEIEILSGDQVEMADEFIAGISEEIEVRFGIQDRAFFAPIDNYVSLPTQECFRNWSGFYSTAFHELGHASGHSSRLNRSSLTNTSAVFGSPEYAREELVAEFTSAFIGAELGVATELRDEHRDYLANWLEVLKNDSEAIWQAAAQASKASAWLLENSGIEKDLEKEKEKEGVG